MKFDEAMDEYAQATHKLPALDGKYGGEKCHLGSYATVNGETRKYEGEVTHDQIVLVLAHFRDTMRMAGTYRYRQLDI